MIFKLKKRMHSNTCRLCLIRFFYKEKIEYVSKNLLSYKRTLSFFIPDMQLPLLSKARHESHRPNLQTDPD